MTKEPPKRIPFGSRRPIDPRICNIATDGNVFNRGLSEEQDREIERLDELDRDAMINFVLGGGVRDEVLNPATPKRKQAVFRPMIFNLRPSRTERQNCERAEVARILQSNAKPETHAADASHLSEAAETGCSYFITRDGRMLAKRGELAATLPPSLHIVTPREFLEIYDGFEREGPPPFRVVVGTTCAD